jgi:hypothetical protein
MLTNADAYRRHGHLWRWVGVIRYGVLAGYLPVHYILCVLQSTYLFLSRYVALFLVIDTITHATYFVQSRKCISSGHRLRAHDA